jgi:hypothetical protein
MLNQTTIEVIAEAIVRGRKNLRGSRVLNSGLISTNLCVALTSWLESPDMLSKLGKY